MRATGRRILFFAAGAVLFVLLLLGAAVFTVARDPGLVKPFVEGSLGTLTGLETEIGLLDWDTDPLRVKASGIAASTRQAGGSRLNAELGSLDLELAFEGGFGERTLVVRRAAARGLDLELEGAPQGLLRKGSRSPASAPARLAAGLARWLLFHEVRVEEVALGPARLSASLPGGRLVVEEMEMDLRPSAGSTGGVRAGQVVGELSARGGRFKTPMADVSGVSIYARARLHPGQELLEVEGLDIVAPRIEPAGSDSLPGPAQARLTWEGRLELGQGPRAQGPLGLTGRAGGEELSLRGDLLAKWGDEPEMTFSSIRSRIHPARWIPMLPSEWRAALGPVRFSGPVSVSGGMRAGVDKGGRLRLHPDLDLEFLENPAAFENESIRAEATLSGTAGLRGTWPDPAVSADIRAEGLELGARGFKTEPSELTLGLEGDMHELGLARLDLSIPSISIGEKENRLPLEGLEVRAAGGTIRPVARAFSLPEITMQAAGLGPVRAAAEGRPGLIKVSVKGEETGLVPLLSGTGLPLEGWGLRAGDRVRAELEINEAGLLDVKAGIGLEDASFENPALEAFGEGLSLSAELSGGLDLDSMDWICRAGVRLGAGEMLAGKFYVDMGKHPLSAGIDATGGIPVARGVNVESLDMALEGIFSAGASGRVRGLPENPAAELLVEVPPFDPAPAFKLFVAEPLRMDLPLLGRLRVRGRASSKARISFNPEGLEVEGRVELADAGVRLDEPQAAVSGVELSLPFAYAANGAEGTEGRSAEGGLSVEALEIPLLPVQGLSLLLEAGTNRLRVPHPVAILIPGGKARLGPLNLEFPAGRGPRAETGLTLERVELRPILSRIWPGSPEGAVEGLLDPVIYSRGGLGTGGSLEAQVFGGRVTVSDISASGVFSRAPALRLDARWEDLDLEMMTSGTSFGLVKGMLSGWARDLEFAYGQPQRFELLLETEAAEGVEQRISVRAVDNISRIGGGGSPFAGMAGIFASLFKEFPYEKIGIRASLENDIFRINGTIHEGGKEFLVKRSGFSGVNVVNQNPDNRISFKDMVKRIQRVTSSQGGPVIK